MHVIADLCIIPIGIGVSVSEPIAECQRILNQAGLTTHVHAYGTNIEGEWGDVMHAIKQCHQRLHEMNIPRLSTSLKLGTRTDRQQSMADKVRSVQEKL